MTRRKVKKVPTQFKAGELITIATGYYSDYTVEGVFRVLKGFDPNLIVPDYIAYHKSRFPVDYEPDEYDVGRWSPDYMTEEGTLDFFAWLIKEGWLATVDSREWHLGDYRFALPYEDVVDDN